MHQVTCQGKYMGWTIWLSEGVGEWFCKQAELYQKKSISTINAEKKKTRTFIENKLENACYTEKKYPAYTRL